MIFLLDTHVLIWTIYDPDKLPDTLRQDIEDPSTALCFSSISALEISIKQSLGKLELDLSALLKEAQHIGIEEHPFKAIHALPMLNLPPIHADPFDRALIAQAMVENFTLVTRDETIQKYPVTQRWL